MKILNDAYACPLCQAVVSDIQPEDVHIENIPDLNNPDRKNYYVVCPVCQAKISISPSVIKNIK